MQLLISPIFRAAAAALAFAALGSHAQTPAAAPASAPTPTSPAAATPAAAPTGGATRATIDKLMDVTQANRMPDALVNEVRQMMAGTASQMGMEKADKPLFDKHLARVVAIAREDMGWAGIKPQLADVYSRHYTEEEAQGLVAFYQSPTGQALLKKGSLVAQDTTKLGQQLLAKSLPRFQKVATDMQAEMVAQRGKASEPAAAPAKPAKAK